VEDYTSETPPLEAKLPTRVNNLADFVKLGTAIANSESLEGVLDLWMRRTPKGERSEDVPEGVNAWISIEDGSAALYLHWKVDPPAAERGTENARKIPVQADELPLLKALQSFAKKETGFPTVVGMEVRILTWHNLPGRIPDITHKRTAMYWTVHLRKGAKKAERDVLVFPAKPKEAGRALGKDGLRLLYIYTDKTENEWDNILRGNGGSSESD
jgi:hypothetical protein